MPKVPIDYSKILIYKIVHKDDINNENVYVGSTTNFTQRKWDHATCCNSPNQLSYNTLKYRFIRENGGWDNWKMIEIEKYPCNDKREAEARERYWIEFYKCNLNKNLPIRTSKEYYNTHKEELLSKSKEYNIKNKNEISINKKKYYEMNKDNIIEQRRKYRSEHPDIVNQKTLCECGCTVGKAKLKRHQDSAKHKKLMETKEQI